MSVSFPESPVYWRIYMNDAGIRFVCMQDFDENDYDQSKFLNDVKCESEGAAQEGLDAAVGKAVRLLQFVGVLK